VRENDNMNEILFRKHLKSVMRYGINKEMARDIVQTAMSVSKSDNIDMALNYAIDITYGLGFSQKMKVK
jgi:hypothetical protein